MRVSVVIPSFYPAVVYGGTIFASLNYARLITGLGHIVHVSTTNTNKTDTLDVMTGQFIELDKNLFVKYYQETILDKLSLPLLLNIHKDIKKAKLVHIQAIFNTPIPVALFYSWLFKKPVLLSPHGVLGEWIMRNGSMFKKVWLKLLIKPFANYVIWHATSGQEKKEILSHFPFAKVSVIPNPISLEEFKKFNTLKRSDFLNKFANLSGDPEKILISMGRLQKKKGFDILIKAFQKVQAKYPDAYLFIAGHDEGEMDRLLHLVNECHLNGRVFFTGMLEQQDKIDFLANADLFILPSHNENFGIVYAEALAAGTPVVASTNTPWEEVEKFGCGKWVKNTVEENESAILEMLTREDKNTSRKAQEYVLKFSFENVSKEFEKVFNLMDKQDA